MEDKLFMVELEKLAGCPTPGEKLRSWGQGRGLARGKGTGPIGVPLRLKLLALRRKLAAQLKKK